MPGFGALILVVASNVLYHVAQKSTPRGADPYLATAVAYLVALPLALTLWYLRPERIALVEGLRALNGWSVAVGVTIVGVEMGFLLAYRAGWNVSMASALSSATLAGLLVVVGLVFFRERLVPSQWLGLALCVGGIVLLVRR
jgi:drug/metabolite transporter (DMT)-like permease